MATLTRYILLKIWILNVQFVETIITDHDFLDVITHFVRRVYRCSWTRKEIGKIQLQIPEIPEFITLLKTQH